MSEIVTRPAMPEDDILLRQAVAATAGAGDDAAKEHLADLKRRLETNGAVLLAEVGRSLAGFVAFCVKGEKDAPLASLEELSVAPLFEALPIDRILLAAARRHLETLHLKNLQVSPEFLTDTEKLSLPKMSKDSDAKFRPVSGLVPEKEFNGSKGPEPTRYGDWEHNGRCTDF